MPKKIELFDQRTMPNRTREELQTAVNEWFDTHPDINDVVLQLSGDDGTAMVMVFYKTTS